MITRECAVSSLLHAKTSALITIEKTTTVMLRKDLKNHLRDECPKRLIECAGCKTKDKYYKITGDHLKECPEGLVECDNEGCKQKIKRCELLNKTHEQVCEYALLECRYAEYGCAKVPRKCLPDNETDVSLHLAVAFQTITKRFDTLERTDESFQIKQANQFGAVTNIEQKLQLIAELIKERSPWLVTKLSDLLVTSLEDEGKQAVVSTFKMKDYELHTINKTVFNSPSFCTFPGGYIMKVKVQPNGNYLSIYVDVVPGENDTNLSWPVTGGEIEVKILNQKYDSTHLSTRICYEENAIQVDAKPVYSSKGEREAIPIGELKDDYTRNDTLYFRVIVHGDFNTKPWLVCTA